MTIQTIEEYDRLLEEKLFSKNINYLEILEAVREDKTETNYDEIIEYVSYFYAIDFIAEKYNLNINYLLGKSKESELLYFLHTLNPTTLDSKEDIQNLFNTEEALQAIKRKRKYSKIVEELKTIFETIFDTYMCLAAGDNYVNMAHVAASESAPAEALFLLIKTMQTSKFSAQSGILTILLTHKKCDANLIEEISEMSNHYSVALLVIKHSNTESKTLNKYSEHEDHRVRTSLADSSKVEEHTLFKLLLDPNKTVRSTAYHNPKISEDLRPAAVFAGGVYEDDFPLRKY